MLPIVKRYRKNFYSKNSEDKELTIIDVISFLGEEKGSFSSCPRGERKKKEVRGCVIRTLCFTINNVIERSVTV